MGSNPTVSEHSLEIWGIWERMDGMRFSFLFVVLGLVLVARLGVMGQEGKGAEEVPGPNYTYYFELVRVVDANTVAVNVDLGFGVWLHNQNLDLLGLPEPAPLATETAEQKAARLMQTARLRDLLDGRTQLTLRSGKDKTTTPPRYVVTLWADGVNVNEALLKGE